MATNCACGPPPSHRTLSRDADDVLIVRRPRGALLGELVDHVPQGDDLVPLGLADPDLDDVDVEAALLARHATHPVLRDPDCAVGVLHGDAGTEASPCA